jgi:hypothetical protein
MKTTPEKIKELRRTAARELTPIGACHYCNDHVRTGEVLCSEECLIDWSKLKGYLSREFD